MSSALNLYATKVFAEHPLALWALDEPLGYVSLLAESDQDLSNWTVEGATVVDGKDEDLFDEIPPKEPFPNSYVSGIIEGSPNDGNILLTSTLSIQPSDINPTLGSFAIGLYVFAFDRSVRVTIGYSYFNPEIDDDVEVIRAISLPANRKWAFVSETFALPPNFSNIKPFVLFDKYTVTEKPYEIAVNGISFGQWAEEFHTTNLGSSPLPLPSNIPINSNAVEAQPYGLPGLSAYYLSSDNVLKAKNAGVPLVFGSSNSTALSPNSNNPSLIIPGYGFLNQNGQYKSLTLEFWSNIQSNSYVPRRICGPIGSEDGIYADGPFVKIKVGQSVGAHLVGEWGRPMLINMRLTSHSASLLVNGEEVITLEISPETVNYPEKEVDGEDFDWIGFYAYDDIPIIQIDCVGIYPYEIPAIVQKRRFVYGQGVEFPTDIKGSNPGNNILIDYSVANYAKNFTYPQVGRWRDGFSENVVADKRSLSTPEYDLPQIKFNNKSLSEWKTDLSNFEQGSELSLTLKPDGGWSSTQGYMLFRNLNFLRDGTRAFYGVFEVTESSEEEQTLFYLHNETNNTYISVKMVDSEIVYTINYQSSNNQPRSDVFYKTYGNEPGQVFFVGFDFKKVSAFFGGRVASFFGTKQSIKLYVGGQKDFENTFAGKIYSVSFCSARSLAKIGGFFNNQGLALDYEDSFSEYFFAPLLNAGDSYFEDDIDENGDALDPPPFYWSSVISGGDPLLPESLPSGLDKINNIASYSLKPKKFLDVLSLEIFADSYWEDYIPLSYFEKFVLNNDGRSAQALDFLQFNIDYPKAERFVENEYSTEGSIVKTYVSFQFLKSGANANFQTFNKIERLPRNGVVRPDPSWLNTKYEVLNDSIIYPPPGVALSSIALVTHIEIESRGIITEPMKIRSLEYASQALGSQANKIDTRFGASIVPYRKPGKAFEYKAVRPFSTYKKTSPYLYLTSNSGIRMRHEYTPNNTQGLSIPINKNLSSFFKIDLLQMAIKYDEFLFPIAPVQIFEIQTKDEYLKFYLVADSNTRIRGQIYAIDDRTNRLKEGVVYYIDGNIVKRPILNVSSWTFLGISFEPPLDFGLSLGALRFTSPLMFNNISYYQPNEADDLQRFGFRKWFAVRSEPDNPLAWGFWAGKDEDEEGDVVVINEGSTWREVLFLNDTEAIEPDASEIYKRFVGTNRIIVDSDTSLSLTNYESKFYKDVVWFTNTVDAV